MVTTAETLLFIQQNYDWLSIFVIIIIFSIISLRYFRNKERRDKEPIVLLLFAIILGIVSVIPSLILSLLLLLIVPEAYSAVIVAPIAEEIGKGILVGVIAWTRLIDNPLDGLVYGGMVGIGFAAAENFLYAYTALTSEGYLAGIFVVSFRSAFQIIGHPLYTGITGYGIGLYKKNKADGKYNKIWLAMLLHALWNSVSILSADYWLPAFVGIIILSMIIMRQITKNAQANR